MWRWLPILLLLAISARAVEVRDARVSSDGSGTRVILNLSARATHRMVVLSNPDRVVVDIHDARLKRGSAARIAGNGVIKQVRLGRRDKTDLRVVLDLSRAVHANSFMTASNAHHGYRLVIDVSGARNGAPAVVVAKQAPTKQAHTKQAPVKIEHAPRDARDLIIAIDAGHGGEDPGATGKNGTREKTVVLAIARALAQQINAEPGMRAVLTRDGDYFVTLRDRMRRARAQQADLFVSVHADSIRDRNVAGSSVYILSQRGATDEASRWLAERENAADLVGGVSLDNKDDVLASVLLDLSQTAALSASQAAADSVLHRLDQIGEIRKHQVQQARFVVLKSPDIPSMLVETAYISNPGEEQRLRDHAYQGKIALAIHQGLRDYFYTNPPSGTRVAQLAAPQAPATQSPLAGSANGSGGQ